MIDDTYDTPPSKGTHQDHLLARHIAVFTTLGVWLVTGRLSLAASVGLVEIAVKFGGYYLHECFWDWLDLHRPPKPLSFLSSLSKNEEQPCQQPY